MGYATVDGRPAKMWARAPAPGGYLWSPSDMPEGVRIRAKQARKSEVLLTQDQPWERLTIYSNLIHDGGRYRLWYGACPASGFGAQVSNLTDLLCYAESEDGFTWTKPMLGVTEFEGASETNIVFGGPLSGPQGHHGSTVFVDPSAPADERYKLIYMGQAPEDEFEAYKRERPDAIDPYAIREDIGAVFGVYGATSPDGFHWTRIPGPLVIQHSDTQTVAYYDATLGKYVGYFRTWYLNRRCVGRAETDDFRRWPLPENILWPGPDSGASEQWYTNAKTLYPGTSDYHLMFPALYRQTEDMMAPHLATSADGVLWSAVPGGPVVTCGEPGGWDAGYVAAAPGLVELGGDRVGLPFTGFPVPHKHPRTMPMGDMALAMWEKGRLAAIEAAERGEFALARLVVKGKRMRVNVRTKGVGHVRVEVADEKGSPLAGRSFAECDAITGNSLSTTVTWQGKAEMGHAAGAPVRVRFRMHKAELFGVEFGGEKVGR